jgi:hypothetical protein
MRITDEATKLLENLLVSNGFDSLRASMQKTCCGTSLVFTMAKLEAGENPTSVDGISVVFENADVLERASTVTITVENGELTVQDEVPSGC